MAAKLTGIVMGMREVEGVTKDGPRKGESWRFLSIEVNDTRYGHIWSCQVRHDDNQYPDLLNLDLVGHRVQMVIKSQSAGERQLQDGRKVMQIRSQVTNLRDLGVPNEDEE